MIRNSGDAVSPVVGVMLMLVVTIILAAVVSGFASGLADNTETTPQASISADFSCSPYGNQTVFSHNGGDAFDLNDIRVQFQSQDTKITISILDVGDDCIAFERVGDNSSTLIKPGDSFIVVGSDPVWTKGITYGSLTLIKDTQIEWNILDSNTGNTIASGKTLLQ
jgi:FlaG/FlaF family flagellin (archaellin)